MRKQHDPIDQLREVLAKQDVSDDELKSIDADVKAVVLRATEFAQTSPEPDRRSFTPILLPVGGRDAAMEPTDGNRNSHAGAVADDGRGNACQMAGRRGRRGASGDVIAEIETDKATMEVEALDDGTIGRIIVPEGTEGVKVNAPSRPCGGRRDAVASPAPRPPQRQRIPAPRPRRRPACRRRPDRGPGRKALPPNRLRTGEGTLTVREALRDAMAEEMRAGRQRVFVMGEEVAEYQGAYKVTPGAARMNSVKAGDRHADHRAGQSFAGLGVGAAFGELRPVVEFMTFNFAMQAIDQIINSAAKTLYMSGGQMGCPIVFRGPNGAASRVAAQHSQCYASWYAHCPGLKVVAPWSAADAKGLLKAAIRDPNPVIFLENEVMYGQSFDVPTDDDWVVPIGRAKVVREGSDVTITAFSIMVGRALEAAEHLPSRYFRRGDRPAHDPAS